MALGGRTHAGLAAPLPPITHPLRTPGRYSPGISLACLHTHLLEIHSAVLLGVLSSRPCSRRRYRRNRSKVRSQSYGSSCMDANTPMPGKISGRLTRTMGWPVCSDWVLLASCAACLSCDTLVFIFEYPTPRPEQWASPSCHA